VDRSKPTLASLLTQPRSFTLLLPCHAGRGTFSFTSFSQVIIQYAATAKALRR
jgi:hypothetical protein